jgi:hypothetical protein
MLGPVETSWKNNSSAWPPIAIWMGAVISA